MPPVFWNIGEKSQPLSRLGKRRLSVALSELGALKEKAIDKQVARSV